MIVNSPTFALVSVYHTDTDEYLLHLLQQGDETAFNTLFARYRDKLYFYLLKHAKSPEIAEEIVTDIFMKLWTGRELALQIQDLGAFLHKVGYYKVLDFLRTTARHERLQQMYIDRVQQPETERADELLIDSELRALLLKAINQLPPQRKLIYRLSREEKLSHEQIARALHLSPSTVNNALVASSRSIARFLQQYTPGKDTLSLFFLLG